MKTDVLIIGAGLIGSMTAKLLRSKGMGVVIVDEQNPMSASKCSFGIWKDSWVNKIIKKEYMEGIPLLEKFAGGIEEIDFIVRPKPYKTRSMIDKYVIDKTKVSKEKFKRVDCSLILNEEFIEASVLTIDKNRTTIVKKDGTKELIIAKQIVIAAGVWTTDILIQNGLMDNLPYLDFQWGSIFKLKGLELPSDNQMAEWAPYKQSVYLKTAKNKALFGDGITIKNPKKNDERIKVNSDRILLHMQELLGTKKHNGNIVDILEGYRPYLRKNSSSFEFVNRHSEFVLSATGGAKNSTILCGHMAKSILREITE